MIRNDDPAVQEQAANALRNMRRLLDANRQVERSLIKNFSRGESFDVKDRSLFQFSLAPKQKFVVKRTNCPSLN